MKDKLILALDQGTTSSRAIVFNHKGEIVKISQKPFEQIFPKPGWVEHDPNEIWSSQISVAAEVIAKTGINGKEIAAIGITNQRETTIVWDRETSEPIYNAIVWQDRRTAKVPKVTNVGSRRCRSFFSGSKASARSMAMPFSRRRSCH